MLISALTFRFFLTTSIGRIVCKHLLVAGSIRRVNEESKSFFTRFSLNGVLDKTFGENGRLEISPTIPNCDLSIDTGFMAADGTAWFPTQELNPNGLPELTTLMRLNGTTLSRSELPRGLTLQALTANPKGGALVLAQKEKDDALGRR